MGTIADRIMDDALSNNDFDFKGIDVYKHYVENGSTQMHSLLTSAVMAWGVDSDIPHENTVLTLGSTGNIQFIVDGMDGAGEMTIGENDKLNFVGKHGAQIEGGDSNNTVQISATTFTFDVTRGTNVIDAGDHELFGEITKKNFEFDAKLSEYTGSLQVHGDFITNGHVISRSLNVAKIDDSNVSTGFGFRVTDRDALELYKYDAFNNYTQRIAIFGDGAVFRDDAYSNFPIFGVSNYAPNDQLVLGGGGALSIWETNGANIFYNNGTVIIGNHEATCNNYVSANNYDLEVENKALFKHGLDIGAVGEGLSIDASGMANVASIGFSTFDVFKNPIQAITPVFKGTFSSIYLDGLPENYEEARLSNPNQLWFFAQQSNIEMASFDLGERNPAENGERTVNISKTYSSQRKQFTLGHMFHGKNYSQYAKNDTPNELMTISNIFEASITGQYNYAHLGKLDQGMKTVWFDQVQKDVELRNFKEASLDSLDKLSIKSELSVQSIYFEATGSNPEFDGTVGSLLDISTFPLTSFHDDIVVKNNLEVHNLTIGTVGDITPADSTVTTVGTSDTPFHEGYFNSTKIGPSTITSEQTTIDGQATDIVTIDKPLKITDPAGILLYDGSPLNSLGVEGSSFTSFDYISLSTYCNDVYRIKGDVTFKKDRLGTPSTESRKLYVYELNNESGLIVPNPRDGTYFMAYDDTEMTYTLVDGIMIQQQNVSVVDVNLTDESGDRRKKMLVSTYKPNSINDIIDLDIYLPGTDSFNHKFFVDFNYYHNDQMLANETNRPFSKNLPFGYLSGELTVYDKTKYLSFDQTNDTNKHLIQYISYFDVPNESEQGQSNDYFYFTCGDIKDDDSGNNNRIDGNYLYYQDGNTYSGGDFLLYPKITFRNWKNDRNETAFEVVPFASWDLINGDIVVPSKIVDDWKRKLLELTYSYIKYGKSGKLNDLDNGIIDQAIMDEVLDNANTYTIISKKFNGRTDEINNGIRLNQDIFSVTEAGELNIISPQS